jgi:hypothetical protein
MNSMIAYVDHFASIHVWLRSSVSGGCFLIQIWVIYIVGPFVFFSSMGLERSYFCACACDLYYVIEMDEDPCCRVGRIVAFRSTELSEMVRLQLNQEYGTDCTTWIQSLKRNLLTCSYDSLGILNDASYLYNERVTICPCISNV